MICTYTLTFSCSGMNTMLTVVAMETVHHDYRPTFVHFCKKSMFNDDELRLIVYRAFFTKLCMSKVQSGNLFLFAPFPDLCLLVPFNMFAVSA